MSRVPGSIPSRGTFFTEIIFLFPTQVIDLQKMAILPILCITGKLEWAIKATSNSIVINQSGALINCNQS